MATGTVKWFSKQKGYGFITDEAGNDLFVPHTAVLGGGSRSLTEGDRVSYDAQSGSAGPQAANVRQL